MSNKLTNLVIDIKKRKTTFRASSVRIYYPLKSKIVESDGKFSLVIVENRAPYEDIKIPRPDLIMCTGTYDFVKKMNILLDELCEAIELEDYNLMKKIQAKMDDFDVPQSNVPVVK